MAVFDWGECVTNGAATISCFEPMLKNVIISLVSLSGLALFLMLLVGGFNFLLAGGDQKKLDKAKSTISSAIIGLVIIIVAYLILQTIQVITGVNVTTFQIKIF
jgi:hypothetical protein